MRGGGAAGSRTDCKSFLKIRFRCEISKKNHAHGFFQSGSEAQFFFVVVVKGRNSVLPKGRRWLVPLGQVPGETVWSRISRFLPASAYVIAKLFPRGLG